MNIRYVAQDLDWSQATKVSVEEKVGAPLVRFLKTSDFELSMHLRMNGQGIKSAEPQYEMWAVLQTFDGHCNEVVRRSGQALHTLVCEISQAMSSAVRKKRNVARVDVNVTKPSPTLLIV